jgi:hypothetical protein
MDKSNDKDDDYVDDIQQGMIDAAIGDLADDVIEAIRYDERQMIIDFILREENIYECGEQIAEMIDDMQHYDDEQIH